MRPLAPYRSLLRSPGTISGAIGFWFLALVACSDGKRPPASAYLTRPAAHIDDVVRWRGEITLEENSDVINVFPQVNVTPAGDFLVADGREAQIRVYGANGRLKRWFGARGGGPGEFPQRAAAALPGDSGTVLTFDMSGKYAVFAAAGKQTVATGNVPIPVIYTAKPMAHGLALVVGRSFERGTRYLHVWDPRQKRLARSFFVPPVRPGFEDEAIMAGVMDASVRGDSIAAVFALSDSIFLFTREGARIGAFPVRAEGFRPMTEKFPGGGREAFMNWSTTFSTLSRIFWLPDGSFLVQYYDMAANDQRFSLMRLSRNGERLFEISNAPRLMAVSPDGQTLVFAKPGAEALNQWRLASLR